MKKPEGRTKRRTSYIIDGALQSEADVSILKRCKSPREVFDYLEKWYDPESEGATPELYDKLNVFGS